MSWQERIGKAEKAGGFTPKDARDSSEWLSCAVGERIFRLTGKVLPREIDYNTFCAKADALGIQFNNAVSEDNLDLAKSCHELINQMSVEEILVDPDMKLQERKA